MSARARSADSQSRVPPLMTTTSLIYYPVFLSPSLESWRGIVLQVAEEEFSSRLSLLFFIFIFLKKGDLKHDYSQEDAP